MSTRVLPIELDATVTAVMERLGVPGISLAIWRDGEVETRAYGLANLETGQAVRPDTLFQIGSISKVFTTTLVMQLVDEGLVDLDAPIITYLPELRLVDQAAGRAITLRHVLSHTSGMFGDRFDDYGMGDDALAKAIVAFDTLPQLTQPGEMWTYCNSGFTLAGRVVEALRGQPFEAVMRERLLEPLGMERAFYFAHEAIVYPNAVGHTTVVPGEPEHEVARRYPLPRAVNAAGGIIATAADLLKFAALHMSDGTVDGTAVLSPASMAAMQEPQTVAANFAQSYGLGWAVDVVDGQKKVSHGGTTNGFQAHLDLVPSERFAIAVLTNSSRGAAAYRPIIDSVLSHELSWQPAEPARVSLTSEELAWFAGVYRQPDSTLTVSVDGPGLRVEVVNRSPLTGEETKMPPVPLAPIGKREFVITGGDAEGMRVDVIPAADGRPRFARFGGRIAAWEPPAE